MGSKQSAETYSTTQSRARRRRSRSPAILGAIVALALAGCGGGSSSSGQGKTILIGAVAPLSGAFAESGKDILAGAKLAVKEINDAGGIKSLGGAKLELAIADAGDTPQKTITATRQVLNKKPVAAIGCWYSSLTLAATQVAEQMQIPWVTGSVSDELVERGFHYTYRISAGSKVSAEALIKVLRGFQNANSGPTRLAILSDNNIASKAVNELVQASLTGGSAGSIISNQIWTPPLSDATPAVTAVLQAKPTAIFVQATSTIDSALVLKQLAAQGNTVPVVMGASSAVNPVFLDSVGKAAMEGVFVPSSVSFPGKGSEEIVKKYVAATGQPYMSAEGFTGWSNIWVIAEALEQAKKADPKAVKKALDTMDATDVPALGLLPGGNNIQFDSNGRRQGAVAELLQWQDGLPRVITPTELANGTTQTSK